jgi:hypothetical protein
VPYYVLYHQGRPCTLQLKSVEQGKDGHAVFAFDFIPREPTPADVLAFEREMVRMGIRMDTVDAQARRVLVAVWNARGLVDSEAVQASVKQGRVDVEDVVSAILTNNRK